MSVGSNRPVIAGSSKVFVPQIGVAVAIFATMWIGSMAHSSTEIQRTRQQVHQVSDTPQFVLPVAPACEAFVQDAITNLEVVASTGTQVSAKSISLSDHLAKTSAAFGGQSSAQVLVAIGQRIQEIESHMTSVFSIARQLGEFVKNEKALRASVNSEISALKTIRDTFRKSNGLDKGDQLLATALERQQALIRPYESLKGAFEFLSEWRQNPSAPALLADLKQELELKSRQAVATGQGASHHAKIMNLLGLLGKFEGLVSVSSRELTVENLSEFQNLFGKLWGQQTLAVLDASKHTDRFADFPLNQAIAEGLEPLRPTRGDLGREPMNELVIEKSIYGYDLLYVKGRLEDLNSSRARSGDGRVNRKNVALLDPNISVEGISRGTVLTDTRARFFKSKSVAVLGFFPNGDVLVQELTRPSVRPKIRSISLQRAARMKSVGTSNINRLALYGDLVYRPSESEINSGEIKLSSQTQDLKGLVKRKEEVESDARYSCMLLEGIGCTFGAFISVTGLLGGYMDLAHFGDLLLVGGQLLGTSAAAMGLTYSLPLVFSKGAGVGDGNFIQHPSALAKLPGSDADSLLIRSETLWIGSNSLTEDERQALGIVDGKEWLVSTSGQKLRVNP